MLNIDGIQNKGITANVRTQSAKLRYGLGTYTSSRVQNDSFTLSNSTAIAKKNPIETVYEKFLLKHNQNALLEKYMQPEAIEKMLNNAPVVNQILKEKGVNPVVCLENLKSIENTHVSSTVTYSKVLAEELNLSKKDKDAIALGSLFHDFGKIMMPEEIINKNGKLTPQERSIIDTHSNIGYELLKTTGMDSKALSIVRNHHRAANLTKDYLAKIVSVADVYSALTEKRAYKSEMSPEKAFEIMDSFVDSGKLDGDIVNALKNYVNRNQQKEAA